MALIEHLEQDNWQDFLRRSFEYTLDVLKNDRFRSVGSSVDDLRSWLARGGIKRVKEHLNNQMDMRRFSSTRKAAVNAFLEQLVQENRRQLLDLMTGGILPPTQEEWLSACGLSELQFEDLLNRILAVGDWGTLQGNLGYGRCCKSLSLTATLHSDRVPRRVSEFVRPLKDCVLDKNYV